VIIELKKLFKVIERIRKMNTNKNKNSEFISIKEFASRVSIGYTTAWELSRSKDFINSKVAVKINPLSNKQGGVRINWKRYVDFVESNGRASYGR
jgi:hypothetical protein